MTPLHRALYLAGYTDCRTAGDKTAALHAVPNGTALRTGLQIVDGAVTWDTQSTHYGDSGVTAAKSALEAWVREQKGTVQIGYCG